MFCAGNQAIEKPRRNTTHYTSFPLTYPKPCPSGNVFLFNQSTSLPFLCSPNYPLHIYGLPRAKARVVLQIIKHNAFILYCCSSGCHHRGAPQAKRLSGCCLSYLAFECETPFFEISQTEPTSISRHGPKASANCSCCMSFAAMQQRPLWGIRLRWHAAQTHAIAAAQALQ